MEKCGRKKYVQRGMEDLRTARNRHILHMAMEWINEYFMTSSVTQIERYHFVG
jgi:hypothetical protein